MLLWVVNAYRTSSEVLYAIIVGFPVDLIIEEKSILYNKRLEIAKRARPDTIIHDPMDQVGDTQAGNLESV